MKIRTFWLVPAGPFLITSLAFGATEKAKKPPSKNNSISGLTDGSFAFRNVPPGSFFLRPSHPKSQ